MRRVPPACAMDPARQTGEPAVMPASSAPSVAPVLPMPVRRHRYESPDASHSLSASPPIRGHHCAPLTTHALTPLHFARPGLLRRTTAPGPLFVSCRFMQQ